MKSSSYQAMERWQRSAQQMCFSQCEIVHCCFWYVLRMLKQRIVSDYGHFLIYNEPVFIAISFLSIMIQLDANHLAYMIRIHLIVRRQQSLNKIFTSIRSTLWRVLKWKLLYLEDVYGKIKVKSCYCHSTKQRKAVVCIELCSYYWLRRSTFPTWKAASWRNSTLSHSFSCAKADDLKDSLHGQLVPQDKTVRKTKGPIKQICTNCAHGFKTQKFAQILGMVTFLVSLSQPRKAEWHDRVMVTMSHLRLPSRQAGP